MNSESHNSQNISRNRKFKLNESFLLKNNSLYTAMFVIFKTQFKYKYKCYFNKLESYLHWFKLITYFVEKLYSIHLN